MIESLMEIEIAYNMINIKEEDSMVHPLDTHYLKLNCDIDVSYIIYQILILVSSVICH